MNTNSKFLFDTEFGEASVPLKKKEEAPPAPPVLYTEDHKAQFTEEAYQSGLEAGKAEAFSGIEASMTQLLEGLGGQLQQLSTTHSTQAEGRQKEAASLAYAIASKLAPALMARQPQVEVMKMIEECLVDLHDEPRIVVRASEPVCTALTEKIETLTQATGFQGKVILLPDDTKTGSDCRVEWADGGVERDLEETRQKIEEIVDRFLRSETSNPQG